MIDRELLELAAKAAGLGTPAKTDVDPGGRQYEDSLGLWCKFPWGWNWWNPLFNDSDALRLAGDLSFVVNIWNSARKTFAGNAESGEGWTADHGSDPYAATRRAIVRAAAEIGRQMEVTK